MKFKRYIEEYGDPSIKVNVVDKPYVDDAKMRKKDKKKSKKKVSEEYLNEKKGSFLDNKKLPKEGQKVWALVGFDRKIVQGTVKKLSNIDQKGLANTYLDLDVKGKNYHLDISQIYDHKPKQVKTKDEYGEVTIWEGSDIKIKLTKAQAEELDGDEFIEKMEKELKK